MYTVNLRRIQAILGLLSISFGLVMPLLSAQSESKLPACCRRDGKHGCAMMKNTRSTAEAGSSLRGATGKCAQYPTAKAVPAMQPVAVLPAKLIAVAQVAGLCSAVEQPGSLYRISHDRASQKRGPPVLS